MKGKTKVCGSYQLDSAEHYLDFCNFVSDPHKEVDSVESEVAWPGFPAL